LAQSHAGDDERQSVAPENSIPAQDKESGSQSQRLAEFGGILENSLNEIYIFDVESLRFVLVNRGARENLGYSMDEMREFTPLELKPDFTAGAFAELIHPLRTGEKSVVEFETNHRRKDGSRYPVEVRLQLARFQGAPVFVAAILDTTRRTRAEAEAKESESRFRSYFNLGLIGMAVTSPDMGWAEVNEKLCEILGYPRDELVTKTWAQLTHPDDLAADEKQFERVLRGEIEGYSMEKRFICKEGKEIDASIDVQCLRKEDNSVDQFVALIQDISDRKRAENALHRAKEELELRVEERTAELKADQQLLRRLIDLQEQDRQMIANEIHDGLVQDVVGAHMLVQSIRSDSDPGTNCTRAEQVAVLLKKALAEGRRLIREMRPMVLDQEGPIEAIQHLIADDQAHARLDVAFDHDVQFDRLESRLECVIFRIVQEALNNVKKHGQTDHAAVQLNQQDGMLEIVVRDQGVGFDPGKVSADRFGHHQRTMLATRGRPDHPALSGLDHPPIVLRWSNPECVDAAG
jgi:PAS domain S-box-containing protein